MTIKSLAPQNTSESIEIVANRYRIEKTLGQGGMAVVYQVYDSVTKRNIALKQLRFRSDIDKQQKVTELFEREFHTLMHLSHPRIIDVYDYGLDTSGPYYTMELLNGGDIRGLVPVGWRKACQLMLDICSALSLLHSRRLVHRDLSPRNIRCTEDGLAKLIDFGAMIPMGPCKQVVGTPAFISPEVINLQSLDGRTDLYSLGTTLYYTLTGRNAFPARDFRKLRDKWRMKPPPPSEFVDDIPKALDTLVMSLIHFDPAVRPSNAAEVMERLSAIANLKIDERLVVSQSYLSTPTLVGREWTLSRLRKQLIRTQRIRGGALLIKGVAGVGRTRLIDACVLEGKLMGATVLRADKSHAQAGDYGVVRALTDELLESMPEKALETIKPRLKVLGYVLPELRSRFKLIPLENFQDPDQIRPRVQSELREWFFQMCHHRTILIVVDDIHEIDEPSAAFIAFLSRDICNHSMVIAVSTETGATATSSGAMELLADSAKQVQIKALKPTETEKLLGSVFGQAPNLHLLSHLVHRISQGNPRDIMQLAQHLVDKKIATHRSGSWLLPDKIDAADLPKSITQALSSRIETLSPDAHELVQIMALRPQQSFTFHECLVLTEDGKPARLTRILDELLTAQVLKSDHDRYYFSQQGWLTALGNNVQPDKARIFHLRLAKLFESRGQEDFRVAQHLIRAGEIDRGLDLLTDFSERSKEMTTQAEEAYSTLIQSLPADFYQTYLEAIDLCKERNRPDFQIYSLQSRLTGLDWLSEVHDRTYMNELIHRLYQDSGLEIYHELDPSMDPSARLSKALELAKERYERTPKKNRVLDPSLSIRQLARVIIETTAGTVVSLDLSILDSFPSLQPLVRLSPALEVVNKMVVGLAHRLAGRYEASCQIYKTILSRLTQPDRAGLAENHYRFTRYSIMRSVGIMEASMGLNTVYHLVQNMEKSPTFELVSLDMQILYYLWQGDSEKAEQHKKNREFLCIQKNPNELHKGSFLAHELVALALADDLTGTKRIINRIEMMAKRFKPWIPVYLYAQGEYQRIRGDYQTALKKLEEAIQLVTPSRHQNWAHISGAYLNVLNALGRFEEALNLGQQYLQAADSEKLGYAINYIRMPLSITQAKLNDDEGANKSARDTVNYFESLGATGINLGLAYETFARIAIYTKNYENYKMYSTLCSKQYCSKGNPALTAKYEKLEQEAGDPEVGFTANLNSSSNVSRRSEQFFIQKVSERLNSCRSSKERSLSLLKLLIRYCNTRGGFLYTMQKEGPELSAQYAVQPLPKEMEMLVKNYLIAELDETKDITITGFNHESISDAITKWSDLNGEKFHPVLLSHYTNEGHMVTGLAVLLLDPNKSFKFPAELIGVISKYMFDSGEIITYIAPT